ncbi:MAG: hypothetical protein JXR58_01225 [Bacteroidales bacterium]|nr:hypothetical protein [Bacteroidales bacterium]
MFKKGLFAIMISTAVLFAACGDDKKTDEGKDSGKSKDGQTNVANDVNLNIALPEGAIEFDLAEFGLGITASIMAPEAAYIYDSELITDDSTYSQIIVQMSDNSDLRFSIGPCLESMTDIKNFIKQDMFREFKRYLIEEDNGFIYEAVKNADETTVYHFTILIENGGNKYKIESDMFHDYTIDDISMLYAMAKTLKFK